MSAQRDWYEKDYYQALGVDKEATAKEITKAYRKLARDLHPDKNPGDEVAEEKFKVVAAAYDVLGDDAKRKEYDEAPYTAEDVAKIEAARGPPDQARAAGE